MKKIVIILLVFIMTLSMVVSSASATAVEPLTYEVSKTTVYMSAEGTGSFDIAVPGSTVKYAGVEFVVQLTDNRTMNDSGRAEINEQIVYSLEGASSIIPTRSDSDAEETYRFSCFALENRFTEELVCTVNVTCAGTETATLTIKEIKRQTIVGHQTEYVASYKITEILLVPYGYVLSQDASLSALTVSSGALSPAFSPNTTDYTVEVPNSVNSITVTADPRNAEARVEGTGEKSLSVGSNTITLMVTAEDGKTKQTYTIVVTRRLGGGGGGSGGSGENVTDPEIPLVSPEFPFVDVNEDDWFYEHVYYVWENGLMAGTGDNLFSPNQILTRGMVVTVLHNYEGKPNADGLSNPFLDVAAGQWYTDAVKWAVDKKIVAGYGNGNYGPNDYVTREQLATILRHYADYIETVLPELREYSGFSDETSISDYAKASVTALYRAEIISGRPNNVFDPKGSATRAEMAAMIRRLLEV